MVGEGGPHQTGHWLELMVGGGGNVNVAEAPAGWMIVDECPRLTSEEEKNDLIGRTVLCAHDSQYATGWFIGTVHSRRVTPRDLRNTPTANFVVKYTAKETDKQLAGTVSTELSQAKYGCAEWWVVLQQDEYD